MSPAIGYAKSLNKHPIDPAVLGISYAWLEGTQTAMIRDFEAVSKKWDNLIDWPAGRIFGPIAEYRWRMTDKGLHAVLIVDNGALPAQFVGRLDLEQSSAEDTFLILWGEWVNPDEDTAGNPDNGPYFYAGEIPEVQCYPMEADYARLVSAAKAKETPRLIVRRYRRANPADNDADGSFSDFGKGALSGNFIRCVGFDLKREIGEEDDEPN